MKTAYSVLIRSYRLYFGQEVDRLLLASVSFSLAMLLARILFSGKFSFAFLAWNLFLAWLPYLLTKWLCLKPNWIENRWKFALLFSLWLIFLPNAFYIITDLLHLNGYATIQKWFDLTMIISFAWNGLLLGVLALRRMERIMELFLFGRTSWLFLFPVMTLNALGVYIGRYLRFNSWDVITNPFQLAADILQLVVHPMHNKPEWAMIGCFSLFMLLLYASLKKLSIALK